MLIFFICVIVQIVSPILAITGGTKIESIQNRPFQVAINVDYYRAIYADCRCGGTIISANFVLTAAHCLRHSSDPGYYVVRVGTLDCTWWGTIYEVEELFIHPNYTFEPLRNDIAALKLKTSIEFGKRVQPIPMVDATFINDNNVISNASGYGAEMVNGPSLGYLKQIELATIDMRECSRFNVNLFDNQICANALAWRKDTGMEMVLFE